MLGADGNSFVADNTWTPQVTPPYGNITVDIGQDQLNYYSSVPTSTFILPVKDALKRPIRQGKRHLVPVDRP